MQPGEKQSGHSKRNMEDPMGFQDADQLLGGERCTWKRNKSSVIGYRGLGRMQRILLGLRGDDLASLTTWYCCCSWTEKGLQEEREVLL